MTSAPPVPDRLPPLQHDLLLHSLTEKRPDRLVHQVLFTHPHRFSPKPFLSAWARLAERHPILRTAFRRVRPGVLAAHVDDRLPLPVARHDVLDTGCAAWDRIEAVRAEDLSRPFPAGRAPLWRVTAFAGPRETTPVLFTYHPALLDERSRLQIVEGFLGEYTRPPTGDGSSDATGPGPLDFLGWLTQRDSSVDEEFWRRALADDVPATCLWDRRAASREASSDGLAVRVTTLSPDGAAALDRLASETGVAADMIVEAAWTLVLSRHAGAERVRFGLRYAPRPPDLTGADGVLGVLDRLVVATHQVAAERSVRSWLQQLSSRRHAALEHAWVPQSRLAEWASQDNGGRLFETLLSLDLDVAVGEQRAALANQVGPSLLDAHEPAAVPLALIVRREPEVVLRLTYDPARVRAGTADRLLRNVRTGVGEMVARPDGPVAGVTLVDAQELTVRTAVA